MPYLTYDEDGQTRLVHLNQGQKTVIGRCKSSDICLTANPKASRNHCAVYFYPEGNCFALTDMKSTNGTSLNGLRISTDVILTDGDEIGVGGVKLKFHAGQEGVADTKKELVKTAEAVKAFGLSDITNLDHTQSFKMPPEMAQEIGSHRAAAKNGIDSSGIGSRHPAAIVSSVTRMYWAKCPGRQ